jgi:uncharacterized membrane protein YtjA (UPF0391 family)
LRVGGVLQRAISPADKQSRLPLITSAAVARLPLLQAFCACARRLQRWVRAPKEVPMLHYAIVFLVIALIAALFGFGGIAAGAVSIAKILFFIFVIMAIVAFVMSIGRKG